MSSQNRSCRTPAFPTRVVTLAFAVLGMGAFSVGCSGADENGEDTSAINGTTEGCSDADFKQQYPSTKTSPLTKQFTREIGDNSATIMNDLYDLLVEKVYGDARCGDDIMTRTKELVGRSNCLYRAVGVAFDRQALMNIAQYKSNQSLVTSALDAKASSRSDEVAMVGNICSRVGRTEYVPLLQQKRVNFGIAKTLAGYGRP